MSKKNFHVLQFVDSLELGGAEVMAVNIANILNDNGIKVSLCASRNTGPAEQRLNRNLPRLFLAKRSAIDVKAFLKLAKYVRQNNVTHLHAHSMSIIWASLCKLTYPKLKLIWHDHNGLREAIQIGTKDERLKDFSPKQVKSLILNDRITRLLSFLFWKVIVVNETLKACAEKHLSVRKTQIYLIKNFPYISNTGINLSKKNKVKELLFVSNVREQKSHDFFLSVIDEVLNDCPDWKVLLVGKMFNDSWSEKIISLLESLKEKNRVIYLGGRDDVHDLMKRADLGIMTSKSEGLPVTLLEYGLSGLPIIATNVGACSDVIGNKDMIVEYGDESELKQKLLHAMKDDEFRTHEAKRLNQKIKREFGGQEVFQEMMAIYRKPSRVKV